MNLADFRPIFAYNHDAGQNEQTNFLKKTPPGKDVNFLCYPRHIVLKARIACLSHLSPGGSAQDIQIVGGGLHLPAKEVPALEQHGSNRSTPFASRRFS